MRIPCLILLSFLALLLHPDQSRAERFKTISTEAILELQQGGRPFLLIDALSSIEFQELHIRGSINIPASHVDQPHPLLPNNKDTILVFYCKGLRCTKSRLAARLAMQQHYTNVFIYAGGLPTWQDRNLPVVAKTTYPDTAVTELNPLQIYQQQAPFILDIRGREVQRMGNIPGALKIPLDDLPERVEELPNNQAIIIIDHAGQQSPICARYLHSKGYTEIFILEGGMINWIRQGFPTK